MPKLLIELSGVEYDRLVAYARSLRRTPNQQAAQIVADAMEEFCEAQEDGRAQQVSRVEDRQAAVPDRDGDDV